MRNTNDNVVPRAERGSNRLARKVNFPSLNCCVRAPAQHPFLCYPNKRLFLKFATTVSGLEPNKKGKEHTTSVSPLFFVYFFAQPFSTSFS